MLQALRLLTGPVDEQRRPTDKQKAEPQHRRQSSRPQIDGQRGAIWLQLKLGQGLYRREDRSYTPQTVSRVLGKACKLPADLPCRRRTGQPFMAAKNLSD